MCQTLLWPLHSGCALVVCTLVLWVCKNCKSVHRSCMHECVAHVFRGFWGVHHVYHKFTWADCFVQADDIVERGVSWQDVWWALLGACFLSPVSVYKDVGASLQCSMGLLMLAGPWLPPNHRTLQLRHCLLSHPSKNSSTKTTCAANGVWEAAIEWEIV